MKVLFSLLCQVVHDQEVPQEAGRRPIMDDRSRWSGGQREERVHLHLSLPIDLASQVFAWIGRVAAGFGTGNDQS